jgi:hypothetical protein
MNTTSLISALVGAQTGMMQLAVAARLVRMNADQSGSVSKLVNAAQHSATVLANTAAGTGTNLDVTA